MADETLDFRDLLSAPMSDYPDRPNLPPGKTFYGKLVSITAGASKNKGTPLFHFDVRLTDPGSDVPKTDLDKLAAAGFGLDAYQCGADFYLLPTTMVFLRRFLISLGFSENVTFREALKLDSQTGEPTSDTQETIRGLDVIIKTPPADAQGRVFLNNVASEGSIAGVKR
jgi:hypothetical protein